MVSRSYMPDRGDIVWLSFSKSEGHEQRGRRPALMLSPRFYNERSDLALVCPITSQEKGYVFEIPIHTKKINGVVLVDQLRSIDWRARRARFITRVDDIVIKNAQHKIILLITE